MTEQSVINTVLSHGTVECKDLNATRRFYEEYLGLTVIQPLPMAIYASAGGGWQLVCVRSALKAKEQGIENRFCLHIDDEDAVTAAREVALRDFAHYGIRDVGALERSSGSLGFLLTDCNNVRWEISARPGLPYQTELAALERGSQP